VIQIKVFLWYFSLRFPTSRMIMHPHSGSIFSKLFQYYVIKKSLKINDWPKILIYQYNLAGIYIRMGQEVLQLDALYFYLFRGKMLFK
jgi:hypothetical protein